MRHADAKTIYLKDYQAPEYGIDTTVLHFELFEEFAVVESTLSMRRSPAAQELKLHGRDLVLEELRLNDRILSEDQYTLSDDSLTISDLDAMLGEHADTFNLFCRTRIEPQNNTALEGLYKSGRMFCTQCEAEGFRRITYYLDRPDVMSRFTTTIVADAGRYPTLLSNGNCVARGMLEETSPLEPYLLPVESVLETSTLAELLALIRGGHPLLLVVAAVPPAGRGRSRSPLARRRRS